MHGSLFSHGQNSASHLRLEQPGPSTCGHHTHREAGRREHPATQDNFTYVLPGGQTVLQVLFQTYEWSGQEQPVSDVAITITPVSGGAAIVGPTSDGIVTVDSATYSYTWQPDVDLPPGDYLVEWTATGGDPLGQVVTVVPLRQQSPSPGLYATLAQYQAFACDLLTPSYLVGENLVSAFEVIDEALIGAVYPTDADSMPTNPAHINLFMQACCAQVHFDLANNDPANVKPQFSSTSVAGVTQTRKASAQGGVLPWLAPRAAQILHIGGALASAPLTSW